MTIGMIAVVDMVGILSESAPFRPDGAVVLSLLVATTAGKGHP
jgi:hypothetical protein